MHINKRRVGEVEKNIRQTLGEIYDEREASGMTWIILEHITERKKASLMAGKDDQLSPEQLIALQGILGELKRGRPLQYVLGETEFSGLKLEVNSSVLIPRQETEELVDWIIRDQAPASKKLTLLDIGTGSGCIAIALKKNLPDMEVWACDVSPEALEIASRNAGKNNTAVSFKQADMLNSKTWEDFPSFDILVSNPPYVTRSEAREMADHVLSYEPHLALFVEDHDPLLFYRKITVFARKKLNRGGKLYVEINEAYGKEILLMLRENGFPGAELRKDLNGKDRMLRGNFFVQT